MLDAHLAELYGVSTKALNQAVKRNRGRFPSDFMFQLTKEEAGMTWSQIVTTSQRYRRAESLPYAFTEQGIAMLSSVLKSRQAVAVNILIMRTFVKLREIMATHAELARKIEDMERKYGQHDRDIQAIFKVIRDLLEPSPELVGSTPEKPPIGFHAG